MKSEFYDQYSFRLCIGREGISCSTCNVPLKKASYVSGNYGLYCNICVEFVEEIEVGVGEEIVERNEVVPEVNFEETI